MGIPSSAFYSRMKKTLYFLLFTAFSAIISSCHFTRTVTRNFSDIDDYRFFQNRNIEKAGSPFSFIQAQDMKIGDSIYISPVYSKPGTMNRFVEESPTVAFMIIRNVSLLYEKYSNGYFRDSYVTTFSLAKSFVSILIGIAVKEGKISSVNDPVTRYIPDMKHKDQFETVTIEQLLNMTAGIKESLIPYLPFSIQLKFYYGQRLRHWVKKLRIDPKQKEHFKYSMVSSTQLLALVLENATGKSLAQNLEEKIWTKIGTEYNAHWSTDKKEGAEKAFCCLNARPVDFAKFGRLVLNNGNWNGEEIIPGEWLEKSFSPDTAGGQYKSACAGNRSDAYCYNWWQGAKGVKYYKAAGMYGQYVIVFPEKNLILVQFSKRKGWNIAAYEWEIFYQVAEQLK